MPATVLIDRSHGDVWIVTINRARVRNCVDGETARSLEAAFVSFEVDTKAKVAILRGAGSNFCSGADLSAVLQNKDGIAQSSSQANPMNPDMDTTGPMGVSRLALSKPVIAAISGACLAGGLEVAAWCDLRVMGAMAYAGVTCRLRGVPLIDGGTVRLPRLIGHSRASDMILTGRTLDAAECYSIGFANRLVPSRSPSPATPLTTAQKELDDADVLAAALALAKEIASHPQTCLRNDRRSALDASCPSVSTLPTKRDIGATRQGRHNVQGGERAAMEREFALGQESLASAEFVERLQSFFAEVQSRRAKL